MNEAKDRETKDIAASHASKHNTPNLQMNEAKERETNDRRASKKKGL